MNDSKSDLKRHRCCFTGHRPEKLGISEARAKVLLKSAIQQAISDGYVTFISGMARGIDLWAAEIVIEEREKNSNIHLVCASPFSGFEKRWSEHEQDLYRSITEQADFVKFVSQHYYKACFQVRNEWMVDRVSRLIAAYNGTKGGTKNTIEYANRKEIFVENILD